MKFRRRTWAIVGAVVLAAAVAVIGPGCSALRAGHVLGDALGPASALAGRVVESEERAPHRGTSVRVRLAVPADGGAGPWPAILLVHGAAQGGPDDARMVALQRSLAANGFAAGSIDLAGLAEFRMDAEDPARVASAAAWLASRADVAEDGRVALLGISVGGAYTLLAAADPALDGKVPAVLAFGSYADLEALLLTWMTTASAGAEGMLDPHTEGRRLVLVGNVDRLVPAEERDAVAAAIRATIDGRPVPRTTGLSPAAERVVRAAESSRPLGRADAEALLASMSADLRSLSPSHAASVPRARVFLLHATNDPVVPASQLEVLRDELASRGVDVEAHLTDLFGHVDATDGESPGFFEAWPLLSFVGGFLDAAED